jgi:hypothetical protein
MRGHAAILAGCRPGCSKDDPSRIVGQGAKNDMAGVTYWSGWRIVSAVAFAAVCGILVFAATTRGAWDWDVIGYAMAVLKDGTPDAALHAKTWALVKQRVPAEALADLIHLGSYREAMHATPAALVSQLPLYESKLGYVLLLKALSPVADPIGAMRAVSLVCALGILLILFRECRAIRGVASLAWLPFVGLFGLSELATMLSPDPLAAFLYVVTFAALLAGRLKVALGLAILAVFIRPEGVVLNVMLSAVLVRRSPASAAVLLLASAALCFSNLMLSSHSGWWAQFHFNFVERPADLAAARPGFDFRTYFVVLAEGLRELLHQPWFQAAVGTVILALALLGRGGEPPPAFLLLAIVAAATVRFIVYPSVEMRHYGALLFGLALIVLHTLRSLPKDRPS